jgi:hypothetical protein
MAIAMARIWLRSIDLIMRYNSNELFDLLAQIAPRAALR